MAGRTTELVVSLDGRGESTLSGLELDAQPARIKQVRKTAGVADERMGTRYAKNNCRLQRSLPSRPLVRNANGKLPTKIESDRPHPQWISGSGSLWGDCRKVKSQPSGAC